jgi:hypothetical protein
VRFKLWIIATVTKWVVFLVAIPFANGFPPPAWVSVCWLVFIFGHFATEYIFPGGYRELEKVSRKPFHRRLSLLLYIPGALGGLSLYGLAFADRRGWLKWLTLSELRYTALACSALVGLWWLSYVIHRDFLVARNWPK